MHEGAKPKRPKLEAQGKGEVLGDRGQLAPCPPTRRSGGAV